MGVKPLVVGIEVAGGLLKDGADSVVDILLVCRSLVVILLSDIWCIVDQSTMVCFKLSICGQSKSDRKVGIARANLFCSSFSSCEWSSPCMSTPVCFC